MQKRYIIAEDVNTTDLKPNEVLWEESKIVAPITKVAQAVAVGVGGAGIAGAYFIANKIKKDTVTHINSIEELSSYRNAISESWRPNIYYVEHPCEKNVLIEANLFKDYVLRDMIADLTDYIASQFDLKKLVIGRVVSKNNAANATVKTKELNPDAKIMCDIDCSYNAVLTNAKATPSCRPAHTWISLFPDVISAVSHQAESYENRINISMDLDVNLGLADLLNAGLKSKSNYSFYITYERA